MIRFLYHDVIVDGFSEEEIDTLGNNLKLYLKETIFVFSPFLCIPDMLMCLYTRYDRDLKIFRDNIFYNRQQLSTRGQWLIITFNSILLLAFKKSPVSLLMNNCEPMVEQNATYWLTFKWIQRLCYFALCALIR